MTARTYLPSAPQDLVIAHRERKIGKGYRQLELLVTLPDMERAWKQLSKRAKPGDTAYGMRLFSEIVTILQHLSRRTVRLRRADERSTLLAFAKQAQDLASLIEHGPFRKQGENGPFNKQVYEYFPAEVMEINGLPDWRTQTGITRSAWAYDVLPAWPSLPEVLRELAVQVEKQANDAMNRPRLVERQRDSEDYRQRYFVRALTAYFVKEYGSPLYGTTAYIASAVLDTVLTKEEVEKLTRGPTKPP
jgi:hypothetical protein